MNFSSTMLNRRGLKFFFIQFLIIYNARPAFAATRKKERVITDASVLYSGAPIDYSYNDTTKFGSAPGCPKNDNGLPWLLNGQRGPYQRCFLVKGQHPCESPFEMWVRDGSSNEGICTCDCAGESVAMDFEWKGKVMPKSVKMCRSRINNRALFSMSFLPGRCYHCFGKGPCPSGQWLAPKLYTEDDYQQETNTMICEKWNCDDKKEVFGDICEWNNRCSLRYNELISFDRYPPPSPTVRRQACNPKKYFYSHLLRICVRKTAAEGSIV